MEYVPRRPALLLVWVILLIAVVVMSGFFIRRLTPMLEEAYYIAPQVELQKFYRDDNF